jgi:hypothetical protein
MAGTFKGELHRQSFLFCSNYRPKEIKSQLLKMHGLEFGPVLQVPFLPFWVAGIPYPVSTLNMYLQMAIKWRKSFIISI